MGYSLAFAHGTSFIGGFDHLFLRGVGLTPNTDYAATIPEQTYMVYQLMFAIITPALITGAFAERMKFSAMAVFLSLWSLIVYSPMAHMVWGVGGFLNAHRRPLSISRLRRRHRRPCHFGSFSPCHRHLSRQTHRLSAHHHASSLHGPQLHWRVSAVGRLVRIQCRQRFGSGPLATSAFINTHFAAATAALGWTIVEWIHNGKPTALGAISGAVAGLVAITPASGFVQPFPALLIGLLAGIFCSLMVFKVKSWFGYDDSLDAFGVHGAGGTLGALLTGLFATKAINAIFGTDAATGAVDGHWGQLLNQATGVAVAWTLSAVGTLILLFLVDKTIGLRVSPEDESDRP